VYRDSSCVRQNKSGKVRSSDLGDLDVKSYPFKKQYSEDHTSVPRGCCAAKFLHALENDQVLLVHFSPWAGALLTTFFKGESKIGLKCNKLALITSELKGVALAHDVLLCWGVNASANFGGNASFKIWKNKKRLKIGAIYDNF